MDFAQILAVAAAQGGGALSGAPAFVSSQDYTSAASNAVQWTPFSSLDLSAADFVVFVCGSDGDTGTLSTASSGWSKYGSEQDVGGSGGATSALFYKADPGTETLVIDSTASEQYSGVLVRVTGTNVQIHATSTNGDSTNADPPSDDPGASRDHLRIVACVLDNSGGTAAVSAAPSNYINLDTAAASGTAGAFTATATRSTTASQAENPGAFTSVTEQWASWTISLWNG